MRRRSWVIVVLGCVLMSACTGPSTKVGNAELEREFGSLFDAWETVLAGRELAGSLPRLLADVEPAARELGDQSGKYAVQLLSEDDAPKLAMWRLVAGADPFEPEFYWEHACATIAVADASLRPEAVRCPGSVREEPPYEAVLDVPVDQSVPWARPADEPLGKACSPEQVEVVLDQFQIMSSEHQARLSVRNVGEERCQLLGRPGLRLLDGDQARVIAPGGGRGTSTLLPGQSTWTHLRWRPTSGTGAAPQHLQASLGSWQSVDVQFGYGVRLRPFQLDEGSVAVEPWRSTGTPSLGDVAGVEQMVAPGCDRGRITAELRASGDSSDAETRRAAVLELSNNSYLACRVERVTLSVTGSQPRDLLDQPVGPLVLSPGPSTARVHLGWAAPDGPEVRPLVLWLSGYQVPVANHARVPANAVDLRVEG